MAEVVVVGSYVQDLAFVVESLPSAGESRIANFRSGPGGKGFNQAIAVSRQGVKTVFIGAVGDDNFAATLREFVAHEQLLLRLEMIVDCHSGVAAVTVDSNGQNTISVALGANNKLSANFINSYQPEIRESKVVVVQLESNLEATAAALKYAKSFGIQTILNPAPINSSLSSDLLLLADVITPNETEFAFLLKHLTGVDISGDQVSNRSDNDLFEMCKRIPVETVIVTLGEKGAFFADCARGAFFRIEPLEVDVVDTTGAGDAFTGGLAAGFVKSGSFYDAALFANKVAALSVTKLGTAPSMPFLVEMSGRQI